MTRRFSCAGLVFAGLFLLGLASCTSRQSPVRQVESDLDRGWPKATAFWHETPSQVVPAGWNAGNRFWQPTIYEPLQAPLAGIPGATPVQNDEFCATCHKTYTQASASTVHREIGCEQCHGAASIHLETRGMQGHSVLSFATPEQGSKAGLLLSPAERSEVCLQCHEHGTESPNVPCVQAWRTSTHANKGVTCTDCHRAHYNVPLGTPSVDETTQVDPHQEVRPVNLVQQIRPLAEESPPRTPNRLAAVSPDVCYRCHDDMRRFEDVVHPHQLGVPFDFSCTACHDPPPRGTPQLVEHHPAQFECTTCHDSHGNVRAETRKDLCLTCHNGPHMEEWHGAPHDVAGVACTDCHNPHPKTGLPMAADQPESCYRCHSEMRQLEQVAHPHQLLGPHGFNCNTCHRPHGKVVAETRKDACLKCHDGSPTMAWHSSIHEQYGVACADCHNAHPETKVPQVVNVSHNTVTRPKRLPMSVDEPQACYKCHPTIYGLSNLPSHHPIREGKMLCSDCHDSHGQAKGNLKEDSINGQCYECHAEKEGPFVYEHPPATENCAHCHEPHGTVANDLLRQPVTFLCLRCHSGHSSHGRSSNCQRCHLVDGEATNVGGGPRDPMIPTNHTIRGAMYTDCTQCHTQVHGSDLPEGMVSAHKGLR
jgi:DmsE family decaheme c-type cytochrome